MKNHNDIKKYFQKWSENEKNDIFVSLLSHTVDTEKQYGICSD